MTATSRPTIHIGPHETGTTAIQHDVRRHGKELLCSEEFSQNEKPPKLGLFSPGAAPW